jgi:hypothetical protein
MCKDLEERDYALFQDIILEFEETCDKLQLG